MRQILTLALLCISYLTNAQQVQFTSDDFPGIEKNMINTNHYYLPLNNNEFLIAVGRANRDDVTLVKSDKNCKTLWSVPNIEGYLSAANFGRNILVFSAGNSGKNGYYVSDAIHATLLDNGSGKIITEKDIPTYTKKAVTDIYVLTDSSGNFKYLILRSTKQGRPKIAESFNDLEDFGHTENLHAISLNNNLNINASSLDVTGIEKAEFLGCTCDNNNDIFLASIQDNLISVSKYDAGSSKVTATVTATCNFGHEVVNTVGDITINQNNVWLACRFHEAKEMHRSLVTGIFNFNNKNGLIKQDLLDKDYLKHYAEKTSDLWIIGTQVYGDKLVVIKEFTTYHQTSSNSGYVGFGPLIISVYSSDMKLLKEVSADERMSAFYGLSNSFYKLIDNNLYVFYNSTKFSGIHPVYQVIDLDNFSVSDAKEIKIDDAKLNMLMYSPGIVWFNHTALLPYATQTSLLNPNKMVTKFKIVDF